MKHLSIFVFCLFLYSCSEGNKTPIKQDELNINSREVKKPVLSLWKKPIKHSILNALARTNESNKVITFDLDGTLISESPNYYMIDLLKEYNSIHGNDMNSLIKGLREFMNKSDYKVLIKHFVTVKPPKVYAPMRELLNYLKQEGYILVLCTGSPVELAEEIRRKQFPQFHIVIGSQMNGDSVIVNDKEGKVDNLKAINLRPAIVFGNSSGDFAMMRYATIENFLIIKDNKDLNEYDNPEEYMQECNKLGIKTVSLKNDWEEVFLD